MLEDRILVDEQSVAQQCRWSRDLQHSTSTLNWAKQVVMETCSDQLASHVKP